MPCLNPFYSVHCTAMFPIFHSSSCYTVASTRFNCNEIIFWNLVECLHCNKIRRWIDNNKKTKSVLRCTYTCLIEFPVSVKKRILDSFFQVVYKNKCKSYALKRISYRTARDSCRLTLCFDLMKSQYEIVAETSMISHSIYMLFVLNWIQLVYANVFIIPI